MNKVIQTLRGRASNQLRDSKQSLENKTIDSKRSYEDESRDVHEVERRDILKEGFLRQCAEKLAFSFWYIG